MAFKMFQEQSKQKIAQGDVRTNDTPSNCLENVKYKLKNSLAISDDNLSRLSASDITDTKMEKLDFMQWAMICKNNTLENVKALSRYFNTNNYREYYNSPSVSEDFIAGLLLAISLVASINFLALVWH